MLSVTELAGPSMSRSASIQKVLSYAQTERFATNVHKTPAAIEVNLLD
jgi:heme oxygenase